MRLIVQHGRDIAGYLTQRVILHDDECNTGRSQILLRTTIDNRYIWITSMGREKISEDISATMNVYVQILFQFRTVDCIVGSDVEIVCISRHCIAFGI